MMEVHKDSWRVCKKLMQNATISGSVADFENAEDYKALIDKEIAEDLESNDTTKEMKNELEKFKTEINNDFKKFAEEMKQKICEEILEEQEAMKAFNEEFKAQKFAAKPPLMKVISNFKYAGKKGWLGFCLPVGQHGRNIEATASNANSQLPVEMCMMFTLMLLIYL